MGSCMFYVTGVPASQGSMIPMVNKKTGRAFVIHQRSKELMSWRESVKFSALQAGGTMTRGACEVRMFFHFMRPKSHRTSKGELRKGQSKYATSRGTKDLDKLIRSVLDALTGVLFEDDSQVVYTEASKAYREKDHIRGPGATIIVENYEEGEE